jgi:PAS domain S-box-containing protein
MNKELQYAIDICASEPDLAYKKAEEIYQEYTRKEDLFSSNEAKMVMAHAGQFLGLYSLSYQLANDCLVYFENEKAEYQVGYVLNTLGFIYNYFDDHQSRLEVNLKSLELRKKTGDIDGYSRSLNNTGDTYIKLGAYEKALPFLSECLTKTPEENVRMLCVANSNMGEALYHLNEFSSSRKHFDICLKLSESIDFHPITFNCQLFIGMIYLKINDFPSSKLFFEEAEKTVNKLGYANEERAQLHKQLGNYFEQTQNFKEAIYHFQAFYHLEHEIKTAKQQKEIKSIQHAVEINELQSQKNSLEALVRERTSKLENTLKELSAQELLNRKILNSARNAIIVFNEEGIISDFNPSAGKLLETKLGTNISDYLFFKDHLEFEQVLSHLFTPETSENLKFEFEMYHTRAGNELILDVSFTQVEDDNKKKGISFINDITIQVLADKNRKKELETEITINYFAQSLFKANSVDEVLWGLAKDCISRLEFVDCVIYLIDEASNILVQKAAHGPKNPIDFDIHNPITITLGNGIVGSVAKSGIAEIISDTSKDERYILDDDMRLSEIAVPIKLGEKVIGVIDSEHPKKDFYTDRHLRILTTISKLVANRIDKLKEQEDKERLQKEIVQMNESLERQVLQKTKENIQLNKEIAEKEKSFLMAEMSSLLAHELNTPLANIQNSASALHETIKKHSTIKNLSIATNESFKIELEDTLKQRIIEPARLLSTKNFLKEQQIIREIIEKKGLLNLSESLPELIRLNLAEERILMLLNQLEEVQHLLKTACYEKSISTFIAILKTGVDDITRVVEEVKSLKSLETTNKKEEICLHDVIFSNLKQNFNETLCKNEDKSILIKGEPEKLTQLWNGIWKVVDEFSSVNHEIPVCFYSYPKEKNSVLKVEIPTKTVDINFFNNSTDFNSYAGVNHSLRVRLSILKSILEEHHAKLTYEIKAQYLVFRMEFSNID